MRTIAAGRLLACSAVLAALLMGGCVTLGYFLAQPDPSSMRGFRGMADARHSERVVVADRLGELTGRLTRLEIEAAGLARRLGVVPVVEDSSSKPGAAGADERADGSPRGGPLLPLAGDADAPRVRRPGLGDVGRGLARVEAGIEVLEASLDRIAGVLADRELTTMAYPNRPPVQGTMPRISSGFGVRHDPFTGRLARHMGLDIPAVHGTAILASGGGRVISAGYRGPYGKAVVIDHGDGLQTLYGHCSKLYVRTGDLVMPQQKIAAVGSTGRSTGPHLHFEVIRDGQRVAPGQVLSSVLARNTP
ncbi:MAG TPA: M23 family metallopeptidase [Steroidobacteraceae bacterium]|nr:M23 family metallopeptidase [Steroidobacteraceae bacterium]